MAPWIAFGFSEIMLDGLVDAAIERPPSRPTKRGGSRSSRTRDGIRWTLIARLTKRAKATGEVVWSWRLDAGVK
jgi:hypothetical protein